MSENWTVVRTNMGHLKVALSQKVQTHLASIIKNKDVYFKPFKNPDGTIGIAFASYQKKPFAEAFGEPSEPYKKSSISDLRHMTDKNFVHWVWDEKEKGRLYFGSQTAEELYGRGVADRSVKISLKISDKGIVFEAPVSYMQTRRLAKVKVGAWTPAATLRELIKQKEERIQEAVAKGKSARTLAKLQAELKDLKENLSNCDEERAKQISQVL